MVSLWVNFAATLNGPLRSLRGRYGLSTLLGAVGGPAAYAAGERLGAVTFGDTRALSFAALSAAWALAVPSLLWASAALERQRASAHTGQGPPLSP